MSPKFIYEFFFTYAPSLACLWLTHTVSHVRVNPQGVKYDDKSDVWALGCVLHEMVALQVPFPADTMAALAQQVRAITRRACSLARPTSPCFAVRNSEKL